jgi:hypothetical protein
MDSASYDDVMSVTLVPHASTPGDRVHSLEVRVCCCEPGVLCFRYSLQADLSRLRISSSAPPGSGRRADELWRHTCFEAFIAPDHDEGAAQGHSHTPYFELNFSPSGDWALYRFSAYRAGMSSADVPQAPEISVIRTGQRLDLEAKVHLSGMPELRDARRLRLALTAVLEEDDGRLSYWALRHAPGKPDFHHRDGFSLALTP